MARESTAEGIRKVELVQRIGNDFTYHPPTEGQPELYETIRERVRAVAVVIVDLTPVGREQSLALTHLEEAVFWANAAIARNG